MRAKRAKEALQGWLFFQVIALLLLASVPVVRPEEETSQEDESEPPTAVLFPWFAEILGVLVFLILSRYMKWLPFTAVMFILGTCMGVGAARLEKTDLLTQSITMWSNINGEVLLLVFLPGNIFKDSFGINVRLFIVSIWQCVILAFPMVLAGAALTAIVGFYIFPYDWSWNLAMTFGAILSATDPVAVSSLMTEVGAPARLQMHIGGESLLNDGSAMVFYMIFSDLFKNEAGIDGFGEQIDLSKGFGIFFRMALGGAAVGIGFGLGLTGLLYYLNRRLSSEDNVFQVTATITMAYIAYYVADQTLAMSGVISVVMTGVTTKALGAGMINNQDLMDDFWELVENLLNTALFTLGGVVWGFIIANTGEREGIWEGRDWGYLFLLWVMLVAIRFFLVFIFFPVVSRIGLKSCWQEGVFSAWGGLRGAVGISLAISLDNEMWEATEEAGKSYEFRVYTTKLFGMIGGVTFLTLIINGTLAGPVLKALKLVESTETRKKVVAGYDQTFKKHMYEAFVALLTDQRFQKIDYSLVKHHVHFIRDMTLEDLKAAVKRNKESVGAHEYKAPYLDGILPYFQNQESINSDDDLENDRSWIPQIEDNNEKEGSSATTIIAGSTAAHLTALKADADLSVQDMKERTKELRIIFTELTRFGYQKQEQRGELDGREAFVGYALCQGLDFSADEVSKGERLTDWDASQIVSKGIMDRATHILKRLYSLEFLCWKKEEMDKRARSDEYEKLTYDVHRALAFIDAHQFAQEHFWEEFAEKPDGFSAAAKIVMQESDRQVRRARKLLASGDEKDTETITSHLFCIHLVNKAARYIEALNQGGLLNAREAGGYIEHMGEILEGLYNCSMHEHPDEIKSDMKAVPEGPAEGGSDDGTDTQEQAA